jgi:hypothetical protein
MCIDWVSWVKTIQHTNQQASHEEGQGCPSQIPAFHDITINAAGAPKENLSASLIATPEPSSPYLRLMTAPRLSQRFRPVLLFEHHIQRGRDIQVSLPNQ